jgi:biotin synthase
MAQHPNTWTLAEVAALYHQPFNDLLMQAQTIHREHFPPNQVQISTILSIKTGACPEDCKYCSQSGHYKTGLEKEKLMSCQKICEAADKAKATGATRFCMGAAWRSPPDHAMPALIEMVKEVKARGLETCLTAGMLSVEQAKTLKDAGLDYYNHNLDTSREYYPEVITTRAYDDRLDTIKNVREAGISVCCGGILNLGESLEDRFNLLIELSQLDPYPESVPINMLVPIPGTPLAKQQQIGAIEFARMVALARIMMPTAYVRLSAGRNSMSDELQALCFFAGANSIHYGEKLLTTDLPGVEKDQALFSSLGISPVACA